MARACVRNVSCGPLRRCSGSRDVFLACAESETCRVSRCGVAAISSAFPSSSQRELFGHAFESALLRRG
eukprot:9440172-Lingulodinium_polyedra.AAC.1